MGFFKKLVEHVSDPLGVVTGDKPESLADVARNATDPGDLRNSGTLQKYEDKIYAATGRNVANLANDPLDLKGFASGDRSLTIRSASDPMRVGIDAPSKTLNVTGAVAATIATAGAASSALGGSAAAGAGSGAAAGSSTGWSVSGVLEGLAAAAGSAAKLIGAKAQSETPNFGFGDGLAPSQYALPPEKRLPPAPFSQALQQIIDDTPGGAALAALLVVGVGLFFLARR